MLLLLVAMRAIIQEIKKTLKVSFVILHLIRLDNLEEQNESQSRKTFRV